VAIDSRSPSALFARSNMYYSGESRIEVLKSIRALSVGYSAAAARSMLPDVLMGVQR